MLRPSVARATPSTAAIEGATTCAHRGEQRDHHAPSTFAVEPFAGRRQQRCEEHDLQRERIDAARIAHAAFV